MLTRIRRWLGREPLPADQVLANELRWWVASANYYDGWLKVLRGCGIVHGSPLCIEWALVSSAVETYRHREGADASLHPADFFTWLQLSNWHGQTADRPQNRLTLGEDSQRQVELLLQAVRRAYEVNEELERMLRDAE